MMQLLDLEQGSDVWHELRRTLIGASNSPALLGIHPYKSAIDVYEEMIFGKKPFINKAMKHGSETEEVARNFLAERGESFTPKVALNSRLPFMMASLDGIDTDREMILEIKCPGEKVYEQCQKGNIPKHWEAQIQHQFAVTGYNKGELLIWKDKDNFVHVNIARDASQIADIVQACDTFYYSNLIEHIPPEKNQKYTERTDQKWEDLATQFQMIKKQRIAMEAAEKALSEQIIALCEDSPSKGAGIRVEKNTLQGKVDYSKIDQLKSIDLDKYRGPKRTSWRICEIKY